MQYINGEFLSTLKVHVQLISMILFPSFFRIKSIVFGSEVVIMKIKKFREIGQETFFAKIMKRVRVGKIEVFGIPNEDILSTSIFTSQTRSLFVTPVAIKRKFCALYKMSFDCFSKPTNS